MATARVSSMTGNLFDDDDPWQPDGDSSAPREVALAPGAVWLYGFARGTAPLLLADLAAITGAAPFRHMLTPGGRRMSVAMTNCGAVGWVSDVSGYRYDPLDPTTGQRWPAMPASFRELAQGAAAQSGFAGFDPDACLINRYEPGARLSLHQDKDEQDFGAPIVSVSLGLPAVFVFGGMQPRRSDAPRPPDVTATSSSGAVPRACATTAC